MYAHIGTERTRIIGKPEIWNYIKNTTTLTGVTIANFRTLLFGIRIVHIHRLAFSQDRQWSVPAKFFLFLILFFLGWPLPKQRHLEGHSIYIVRAGECIPSPKNSSRECRPPGCRPPDNGHLGAARRL